MSWGTPQPASPARHTVKRHLSAAARARISARMKGRPHPHKGHPISSATRAKISAALRGGITPGTG